MSARPVVALFDRFDALSKDRGASDDHGELEALRQRRAADDGQVPRPESILIATYELRDPAGQGRVASLRQRSSVSSPPTWEPASLLALKFSGVRRNRDRRLEDRHRSSRDCPTRTSSASFAAPSKRHGPVQPRVPRQGPPRGLRWRRGTNNPLSGLGATGWRMSIPATRQGDADNRSAPSSEQEPPFRPEDPRAFGGALLRSFRCAVRSPLSENLRLTAASYSRFALRKGSDSFPEFGAILALRSSVGRSRSSTRVRHRRSARTGRNAPRHLRATK